MESLPESYTIGGCMPYRGRAVDAGDLQAGLAHQHGHLAAVVRLVDDEHLQRHPTGPLLPVHVVLDLEGRVGPARDPFRDRLRGRLVGRDDRPRRGRRGRVVGRPADLQARALHHLAGCRREVPGQAPERAVVLRDRLAERGVRQRPEDLQGRTLFLLPRLLEIRHPPEHGHLRVETCAARRVARPHLTTAAAGRSPAPRGRAPTGGRGAVRGGAGHPGRRGPTGTRSAA